MFSVPQSLGVGQAISPWKLMAETAPPPSEVADVAVEVAKGPSELNRDSPWQYAPINVIYQHFHNSIRAELRSLALHTHDLQNATGSELDRVLRLLRERYRFMEQVYRYHSTVEDEVVYPALEAKVKNVTQAYSVEHESEEALFDQLTEILAEALDKSTPDLPRTVRRLLLKMEEIHSTVHHHLAKEEGQLFPLLLANFSHSEQAELVAEFFCSIPLESVDSVLSWLKPNFPLEEQQELLLQVSGVVRDDNLGRLLAAWLRRSPDGYALGPPGSPRASEVTRMAAGRGNERREDQPPPVLLLHHIHAAIRLSLREFVEETLALEAAAKMEGLGNQNAIDALASLLEQYRFIRAMCTFHSASEEATAMCAQRLEGAQDHTRDCADAGCSAASSSTPHQVPEQLHGDHHADADAADFDALGRLLADVRSHARRGNRQAARLATKLRESAEAVRSAMDEHMQEEEAKAIPLLAANFSVAEQQKLVWDAIRGMPLRLLESMLPWIASQVSEQQCDQLLETMILTGTARGNNGAPASSSGGQGEDSSAILVELLVQWVRSGRDDVAAKALGPVRGSSPPAASPPVEAANMGGPDDATRGEGSPGLKRRRLNHQPPESGNHNPGGESVDENGDKDDAKNAENPIDHIFQFHLALKNEVRRLEEDARDVRRCIDANASQTAIDESIQKIEGRFHFLKGIYIAHSEAEDNIVFPALERKVVLRNVSHAYSMDHKNEQEMFNEAERLLAEVKSSREDPQALRAAVNRLRANTAVVRANLEVHVRAEENELWPLFNEHFSVAEQQEIVGAIIGITGSEVLQTMISWVAKETGPEEEAAMMDAFRSATRNTRFDKWLESIQPNASVGHCSIHGQSGDVPPLDDPTTTNKLPEGCSCDDSRASGEKAMFDASGATSENAMFRPGWDDIFLINQQQLEAHIRKVSSDPTIEPKRKAYIIQSIMASRYIVAQQQKKQAASEAAPLAPPEGTSDLGTAVHQGPCCLRVPSAGPDPGSHQPSQSIPPPLPKQVPEWVRDPRGCKHYRRSAALVAPCCNRVFTCRLCHDEAEGHKMNRYEVKEMVCKLCHTRQPVGKSCTACGESMGKYHCSICNLFDDSGNDIYHCPSCNVCRRGKGLGIDFFHCMKCNSCMSLSLYKRHKCREQSLEANCVVCHEYLFDATTPIKELPCGHFMHSACYGEYSRHNYTCPICCKSMGDMSVYFQMLDNLVASERLPPEIASRRQDIFCNDCGKKGTAAYHWVYHKCSSCGSYNTRTL